MEEKSSRVDKQTPRIGGVKNSALASARRNQKTRRAPADEPAPKNEKSKKIVQLIGKVPPVGPIGAAAPYVRLFHEDLTESTLESSDSMVGLGESVDRSSPHGKPLDRADQGTRLPKLPRGGASTSALSRPTNIFNKHPPGPLTDRGGPRAVVGSRPATDQAEPEAIAKKTKGTGFFKLPKRPTMPKLPSGFTKLKGFSFKRIGKKGKVEKDIEDPLASQLSLLSLTTRAEVLSAKIAWKTIAKIDAKTRALLMAVQDALWASAKKNLNEECVEVFYALLAYDEHKTNKASNRVEVLSQLGQAFRGQGETDSRAQINLTGKTWALVLGPNAVPEAGIDDFLQTLLDSSKAEKRKKLEASLDAFAVAAAGEVAVFMGAIWLEFAEAVESAPK